MWRTGCVVALAACYSGKPQAGAPCTPALDNCPVEQTCALVAGSYMCVEGGTVLDARIEPPVDVLGDDAPADSAGSDGAMVGAWSLVQTRTVMGSQLSFPATAAGNLIVVGVQTESDGGATQVIDSALNTYVPIANSRAIAPGVGDMLAIELWYAANASGGAVQIRAMAPTLHSITMWEVAGIAAANPLHTAAHLDSQAASGTPAGPVIVTTAPGEFVVTIAIVANTLNGLENNSAFTNDHTTFGNGWAHLTSATAPAGPYQARWIQPTAGIYCATAAAFYAGN